MNQMVRNPELMNSVLRSHPMFANNPQLSEQISSQLPNIMQQVCLLFVCVAGGRGSNVCKHWCSEGLITGGCSKRYLLTVYLQDFP